jgi:ATP-dependent RNA helicase DDX49/DBP8
MCISPTFCKLRDIRAAALHSRLTQREGPSLLDRFRASVVPVLVSPDVGARGLDIEGVALVVHWDIPTQPVEYTHRVGRTSRQGQTSRQGRAGMAVSFVTERDEERCRRSRGGSRMTGSSPQEGGKPADIAI